MIGSGLTTDHTANFERMVTDAQSMLLQRIATSFCSSDLLRS